MTHFNLKKIAYAVLLSLFIISCSKPDGDSRILIYDNAHILSDTAKVQLERLDYKGHFIIVYTVDSLPYDKLNDEADRAFDYFCNVADSVSEGSSGFYSTGILVIGSRTPNYSIIKLGKSYELNGGAQDQYCSREYFNQQMSDDFTPQQKIVGSIEKAMSYTLNYNAITNYLRDEFFGLVLPIIRPDDSFFYRYIVHPFQLPFIISLNIFESFWKSILFTGIFLYLLLGCLWILFSQNPQIFYLPGNDATMRKYWRSIIINLSVAFLFNLPLLIGGLSLSMYITTNGIEFIPDLVQYGGLSLNATEEVFSNIYTRNSYVLSFFVAVCYYASQYSQELEDRIRGHFKLIFLGGVLFFLPIGTLLILLCYLLPNTYLGLKASFKDEHGTYIDMRIHGHNKSSALAMSIINLVVIPLGLLIGFYFGEGREKFEIDIAQEQEKVEFQHTPKVNDVITTWYYNVAQTKTSLE